MSNFAFFIGIDWADKKHDIAVVTEQGKLESLKVIEHSLEAVDAWLSDLLLRANGRPIAIMLEQVQGRFDQPARASRECLLVPYQPQQLTNYRGSFQNTKSKNDKQDATLLARCCLSVIAD